ncbi:MAG: hypothetical protein NVSMB64_03250 [Candidatus Velthaea sp.]
MKIGVGFDFDHTLGLDHGLELHAYYELAQACGMPIDPADSAAKTYIADVLARFRADRLALDAAVAEFCTHFGLSYRTQTGLQYRNICYALVDEHVTPIEGARDVLDELHRRGVPTAILTNGWSPLQALKTARALAYAGPLLVSDELGLAKPAAAAFDKLVAALGVDRESCWYVGDNPSTDVAGAKAAGLHGVWFDWEHVSYPAGALPPDVVVHSLRELLDVLPGQRAFTQNVRS